MRTLTPSLVSQSARNRPVGPPPISQSRMTSDLQGQSGRSLPSSIVGAVPLADVGSDAGRLLEPARHGRGKELDDGANARRQMAALSDEDCVDLFGVAWIEFF